MGLFEFFVFFSGALKLANNLYIVNIQKAENWMKTKNQYLCENLISGSK